MAHDTTFAARFVNWRRGSRHGLLRILAAPLSAFSQATHKNEPQRGVLATLQSLLPQIAVSKQSIKKLEGIQLIRAQRENRKQELAFHARPFVLCGLPLRQPPQNQLTYTRRNGKFFLEITAHPRFGLPYGQDRLIPIWLATLTLQQRSRIVHFDSPTQLLDYFRLPKDGAQYRRMEGAFQRVFAATIFFGTEEQLNKNLVLDWSRFHFFDRMTLLVQSQ